MLSRAQSDANARRAHKRKGAVPIVENAPVVENGPAERGSTWAESCTRFARTVCAAAIAFFALGACASAPELSARIQEGEPCRLDYYNARGDRRLALINKSFDDPGSTASDGTVSRVDDEIVRVLISDYENLGFFKQALPAPPMSATDWIAVRSPRATWVFAKPRDPKALQSWHTCAKGFTAVWNRGDRAFGRKGFGSGKGVFEAERERLLRMNQRIKNSLGDKR